MRIVPLVTAVLLSVVEVIPVSAQYAEIPRPLPVPASEVFGLPLGPGSYTAATQIGRRLFVAGSFTRIAPPTGSAVVVDANGSYIPAAFPRFSGRVEQIVADNAGGWLVVGAFTSVDGQPVAGFARVASDRTVDSRFRVVADGPIRKVALAHGRIYLLGEFTSVNGATRRGLAALDAATGVLSAWGAGFDPHGPLQELSFSSIGVYVAGGPRHLWGFDAMSGRVLFDRRVFVSAIAASSERVYVGSVGASRPVWAVDPLTGQDTNWSVGVTFDPVPVTYGQDGTQVTALLLDGGRLYVAGSIRSSAGQSFIAVAASDGRPSGWVPAAFFTGGTPEARLFRLGPAVVAGFSGSLVAFDVTTAAAITFAPNVYGAVNAVAAAPEGAVVGGDFDGSGGVNRAGLASIDLDTYSVEPWTSALSLGPFDALSELATDGTWLFGRTEGDLGGRDARVLKIDPATGAVVAERTFPSVFTRMRVAGSELVVSTTPGNGSAGAIGAINILDWSYRVITPSTDRGVVLSLDVDGDTIYLGGTFLTMNGQDRPRAAAIHRVSGAVLPWRPASDNIFVHSVRTASGRVWVGGDFDRVGGARRRGLAELDPVTGAALAWNPHLDVSGGVPAISIAGGYLHASTGGGLGQSSGFAAGQPVPNQVAYSLATGRRLRWNPTAEGFIAVLPDCLLTVGGCLERAVPAPTALQVAQAGASLTFSWALPAASGRTGVRLEVGSAEGRADLVTLDLAPTQASFVASAPPGSYFVRVRALAGSVMSLPTEDVSVAVGPPSVPAAALDLTAITDGRRVSFAWQRPSTGAPARYEIEAGTARGRRDVGAAAIAGSATSLTLDDIPAGPYWVRVVAANAAGRGAASNDVFFDLTPRFTCSTSPPQSLTATVAGRRVTFTWQSPADGSDDPPRLVAGSTPAANDIGSLTMPPYATSFTIDAPPGTYYVRLVVGCFTTAASNEVQVVVP